MGTRCTKPTQKNTIDSLKLCHDCSTLYGEELNSAVPEMECQLCRDLEQIRTLKNNASLYLRHGTPKTHFSRK